MKAMVASYEELKFLQDGLVKYEEIHPPQASSHTGTVHGFVDTPLTAHPCPDPIIETNFAYDLAPNFKEGNDLTAFATYGELAYE